jgi:septal ring factor EnvC (AmiA/AmiB activator)
MNQQEINQDFHNRLTKLMKQLNLINAALIAAKHGLEKRDAQIESMKAAMRRVCFCGVEGKCFMCTELEKWSVK